MRLGRRTAVTIGCTLAAIFLLVRFVAPIALSFYTARRALPVARILPTELQDHSISQAKGISVSYVGYEFEIPWDDLDESETQLYPKDKPTATRAVLAFRSGLRLMVSASLPREMVDGFTRGDLGFGKMGPRAIDGLFGPGSSASDFALANNVYEFTPDKMHYWSLSDRIHYRETILLTIKSIMPSTSAESGIFRVQNRDYKGFQQGNPAKSPRGVVVSLYSDEGGVEFIFSGHDYHNSVRLTQPEINRIIQSLHRAVPTAVAASDKAGSKQPEAEVR
jgi:hypothetical protein